MGYIYIVKNDINDNVYIGQTSRSLEVRWKEHVRHTEGVLEKAIIKYGKEHFWIESIEECDDALLDEREQYWIQQYNSFYEGYNATIGGQGPRVQTNKLPDVLALWQQGLTVNKIVSQTGLNVETVRSYLNKSGITHEDIRTRANIYIGEAKARPIYQYDLQWNFIQEWPSAASASAAIHGTTRNNIARACKTGGTALGYHWKYKDKE